MITRENYDALGYELFEQEIWVPCPAPLPQTYPEAHPHFYRTGEVF